MQTAAGRRSYLEMMDRRARGRLALAALAVAGLLAADAGAGARPVSRGLHLPWRQAGWTERAAAAHLLDRFAFGPRPGEVDAVVAMGLDRWLERQIDGPGEPDPALDARLARYPALALPLAETLRRYPADGVVRAEARRAGVLPDPNAPASSGPTAALQALDDKAIRERVKELAAERGYLPEHELVDQAKAQKLLRAVYAEDQLAEVMADFWFNHFNVSLTNDRTRSYLLSYERDAIRPHALGRFRDLLEATARHPAMLHYLDNAQSVAPAGAATTAQVERAVFAGGARRAGKAPPAGRSAPAAKPSSAPAGKPPAPGLNENYARELMELHTLGVDGGYTQRDVVEVARAFTGWTAMPPAEVDREKTAERLAREAHNGIGGSLRDGEFLFRADTHDAGAKTVLGHPLPAGRGIEDGEEVLDLLAAAPATARHLARALAVRFVADHPSPALVDRLAGVYLATGGDVRALLRAIAESPELWRRDEAAAKVKSPFELAVSALRALGAEVTDPRATLDWIGRIGEPLYACQPPTGYPDRAEAWVNTGALLARMSFGLQLAAGKVGGVKVDVLRPEPRAQVAPAALPAARQAALAAYGALLLPGRDLGSMLAELRPLVDRADFPRPSDQAARAFLVEVAKPPVRDEETGGWMLGEPALPVHREKPFTPTPAQETAGLVLGSPEFQRR